MPSARANVPLAMARQAAYGIQVPLALTASGLESVQAVGEILRGAAAANGLTYVDLIPSICRPHLRRLMTYPSIRQRHVTSPASRQIIVSTCG
jgi:hypothetical protein